MSIINIPKGGGTADSIELVANVGALPSAAAVGVGAVRVTEDDGTLYISDGTTWNSAGGGGGAVAAVNGQTGVVTVQVGDGSIGSSGAVNQLTSLDATGQLVGYAALRTNVEGGLDVYKVNNPDNENGNTFTNWQLDFIPLQNSPNEVWNSINYYYNIDPTSTGFSFGSNGESLVHAPVTINAQGSGDLGAFSYIKNNFTVGNGTDPIDWKGVGYSFGFGQINDNVTLVGSMQGYGFQWNMTAGAIVGSGAQAIGFYDFCNVDAVWDASWTSYQASPNIAEITTNHNYTGFSISPNIDLFSGNANFNGVAISPIIGGMGYGSSFTGVNVSPQTSTVYSAFGLNVSLDNVTTFAGVQGTQTKQDLTFTFNTVGEEANTYTLEYIPGGTAGSELVTNIGQAFTVQIQSGVSTATQIKTALDASSPWGTGVTTAVSGVGSNAQVSAAATPFAGGLNPGQKLAAYLDGDVQITGTLTFGGALSIGALNSFGQYTLVDGAGPPQSVSTLITQPTVGDNETLTNADLLGVNTAMLLTVGDNSSITTGFLGVTALGLPAVVSLGTGTTIDRVGGAVFAISLDSGAAGGTIDTVSLCRAIAIPNGVTTITRLYGYEMNLPFGDPGTTTWGIYIEPDVNNWMQGRLRIGGATVTDDTTAYQLHVDGDAFFENGDLGFFGTAPVAQQTSSGPQTAGAVYTATEQTMIQEMYNAMRAYGLLS